MAHFHALLASKAPTAVLLKRGPGKVSATIGWDRRTDTFTVGQWLRQTIEYRDTDLSADGQYLLYYVNTQQWGRANHVYRAISRAPWLKALTFWGSAVNDFGPGTALFVYGVDGSLQLWASSHKPERDAIGISLVADRPSTELWKPMVGDARFFLRLQRDGWLATTGWEKCPIEELVGRGSYGASTRPHRIVFEKTFAFGWTLRQTHWVGLHRERNRGVAWETFSLQEPGGKLVERPSWEWADVDRDRNRVVFTEDCVLQSLVVDRGREQPTRVLFDAREMRHEDLLAPY